MVCQLNEYGEEHKKKGPPKLYRSSHKVTALPCDWQVLPRVQVNKDMFIIYVTTLIFTSGFYPLESPCLVVQLEASRVGLLEVWNTV